MKIVSVDDSIALNSWMEDNYVDTHQYLTVKYYSATHIGCYFSTKSRMLCSWLWAKCQGYTIQDN